MRPASPLQFGEIAEYYPKAEENLAVSRVFFRETVIFRDIGPVPARAATGAGNTAEPENRDGGHAITERRVVASGRPSPG
jgi:hypothetical protein